MRINFKILLLLCFCGGLVTPSVSGQKPTRHKRVKKSKGLRINFFDATVDSLETAIMADGFVYGGTNFTSNVNDLGRDNNVQQSALNPVLGFQRNNLDVYVNGFAWSKASPNYIETDIGISKTWQLGKSTGFVGTYEHAFVHYGSDEDRFGLNNLASVQFIQSTKYLDFAVKYDYSFGLNCATTLELSVGHEFNLYNVFTKDKLDITPQFYLSYLGGNTYPIRLFRTTHCSETDTEAFKTANYECSLPITWHKVGALDINLTFNYALPQNVFEEEGNGKPLFYVTASLVKIGLLTHRTRRK